MKLLFCQQKLLLVIFLTSFSFSSEKKIYLLQKYTLNPYTITTTSSSKDFICYEAAQKMDQYLWTKMWIGQIADNAAAPSGEMFKFSSGVGISTQHPLPSGLVWVDADKWNVTSLKEVAVVDGVQICRCMDCGLKEFLLGKLIKNECKIKLHKDDPESSRTKYFQVLTNPKKLRLRWRRENPNDWISAQSKILCGKSRSEAIDFYIARKVVLVPNLKPAKSETIIGTAQSQPDEHQFLYHFWGDSPGETLHRKDQSKDQKSSVVFEILVFGGPDLQWIAANQKNVKLIQNLVGDGRDQGDDWITICRVNGRPKEEMPKCGKQCFTDVSPGKLSLSQGICKINYLHKYEAPVTGFPPYEYQVLTNPENLPLQWIQNEDKTIKNKKKIPKNAVLAGFNRKTNEKYYIGRTRFRNTLQLGRVEESTMKMYFTFNETAASTGSSGDDHQHDVRSHETEQFELLVLEGATKSKDEPPPPGPKPKPKPPKVPDNADNDYDFNLDSDQGIKPTRPPRESDEI